MTPHLVTRSRTTRLLVAASAAVLGLTALAAVPSAHAAEPTARSLPAPTYLFTVEGAHGTTAPLTRQGTGERFTLTLDGLDAVTMFTDRPFRRARLISPAALSQNWSTWFADSAPNAVLTWDADNGKPPTSLVVALTKPRYDSASDALAFTAFRIRRLHEPAEKGVNWKRQTTPAEFTTASLFIDSTGTVTVDGCTVASGASCPGADLSGANLSYLEIVTGDFSGANMQRVTTFTSLFQYVDFTGVDFAGADLSSTLFAGATLNGINAPGVSFEGSSILTYDAMDANFRGANMQYLSAENSVFTRSDFTGANLRYADLLNADFTYANLSGVDFTGATINGADFRYANLRGATIENIAWASTNAVTVCPNGETGPCAPWTPGPNDLPSIDPDDPPDNCTGTQWAFNPSTGQFENITVYIC
jgi:BTB/POZ domain-containing protein KCTD9